MKILICLIPLLLLGCGSKKPAKNPPLLRVKEVCRKPLQPSEKFVITSSLSDPVWGVEQTWEFTPAMNEKHGLNFFILKIEQGKLQSVWFSPRHDLEGDLKKLGLKSSELTPVSEGHYQILDNAGLPIQLQHAGSDSQGMVAECFEHRPGH